MNSLSKPNVITVNQEKLKMSAATEEYRESPSTMSMLRAKQAAVNTYLRPDLKVISDDSRLYFTIGLPRSGKSTFAADWQKKFPKRVVLSGDDFRLAVYGKRFQYEGEPIVRASLITAARALLHAGYEVLIDETNTTSPHVYDILNIDPDATAYIFSVTPEECIDRAIDCEQLDLIEPIKRMNENLMTTHYNIKVGTIPIKNIVYV
jgi:predicted kinase